eukprot:GHVU01170742.1.p3 GENE.GHVU01170742.1~~GHVU01170742.1.p3  ORF type:complete len:109 (+),score=4.48 GHVU01170742.1:1695-2021(+)
MVLLPIYSFYCRQGAASRVLKTDHAAKFGRQVTPPVRLYSLAGATMRRRSRAGRVGRLTTNLIIVTSFNGPQCTNGSCLLCMTKLNDTDNKSNYNSDSSNNSDNSNYN